MNMEQKLLPGIPEVVEIPKKKSKFLENKNFQGLIADPIRRVRFPVYMIRIPQHPEEIGFMMIDPESLQRLTVKPPKDGWRTNGISDSQGVNLKKIIEEMFENNLESINLPYCNILRRYDEGYVINATVPVHNYTDEREQLKHIYMHQVPGFPRSQILNRHCAWVKVGRNGGTKRMKASRFRALKSFQRCCEKAEIEILELRENTQTSLEFLDSDDWL